MKCTTVCKPWQGEPYVCGEPGYATEDGDTFCLECWIDINNYKDSINEMGGSGS
jgi:uncharacterized membrane protein